MWFSHISCYIFFFESLFFLYISFVLNFETDFPPNFSTIFVQHFMYKFKFYNLTRKFFLDMSFVWNKRHIPPPLFYLDCLYLQHTAFHSLHKFELFNFHTLDLWMYHSVCFFSHEVHFYFCILYSIILHHYFNFHFDRMMINQVLCIICRYKPLILFEL